jgi:hypothetical protein
MLKQTSIQSCELVLQNDKGGHIPEGTEIGDGPTPSGDGMIARDGTISIGDGTTTGDGTISIGDGTMFGDGTISMGDGTISIGEGTTTGDGTISIGDGTMSGDGKIIGIGSGTGNSSGDGVKIGDGQTSGSVEFGQPTIQGLISQAVGHRLLFGAQHWTVGVPRQAPSNNVLLERQGSCNQLIHSPTFSPRS